MALIGIPRDLKDIMRSDKPGKKIALLAAATIVVSGIKMGWRSLGNYIDERVKRKTNKKQVENLTVLENLKHQHRQEERKQKKDYARRRREEYKQQPETTPDMEEVYTPPGKSLDEQIKNAGDRLKCLVEGLIELGGFIVLLGKDKIGKSTFLMQLAIDIAKGVFYEFLPRNDQKTHSSLKVLYIDLEMKIIELKERLKNIAIPTNLLWESEIYSIGSLISYIRENIKGCTECVVILDNLKKMADKSTNHYEVNNIFKALQDLQKELMQNGITLTIIVANHTVKGYNPYRPISTSDASSSVEISQFSTGVIALAPAKDGKTMIKKVSSRNFPTDDTVLVVERVDAPYQHFKFVKKCTEAEALPIEPKACKKPTMGACDHNDEMENSTEQMLHNALTERGLDEQVIDDVLTLDDVVAQMVRLNELGLEQAEIGEIFGYRRETVNKKINAWKKKNDSTKVSTKKSRASSKSSDEPDSKSQSSLDSLEIASNQPEERA